MRVVANISSSQHDILVCLFKSYPAATSSPLSMAFGMRGIGSSPVPWCRFNRSSHFLLSWHGIAPVPLRFIRLKTCFSAVWHRLWRIVWCLHRCHFCTPSVQPVLHRFLHLAGHCMAHCTGVSEAYQLDRCLVTGSTGATVFCILLSNSSWRSFGHLINILSLLFDYDLASQRWIGHISTVNWTSWRWFGHHPWNLKIL